MRRLRPLLAALLFASAACGSAPKADDPGASCAGGKCDELEGDENPLDTPCDDVLIDRSGRGFLPERLANDAFIQAVYMDDADGCPTDTAEIMEVLSKNDDRNCGSDDGLATRVITEQAQLHGSAEDASYRTVITRTCDNREEFALMFSLFGFAGESGELGTEGDGLPNGLEVIAFDEENRVFNYYKEVDGEMAFFGSSTDYVTEGPGGPGLTSIRGCANCHTGGGLIMKELTQPWVHWEEIDVAAAFRRFSPGAEELVENRESVMGRRKDGPSLEDVIRAGNEAWNDRRIDFLIDKGSVNDLLRPLFCPVEVNVTSEDRKNRVADRFLFDRSLSDIFGMSTASSRISLSASDYDDFATAVEQVVPGSDESDLVNAMTFIERSAADMDYVEKLIERDIISEEFAVAALMVDFTRPVFSDSRCGLLDTFVDVDPDDRNAEAITEAFIEEFEVGEEGSPAAEFVANLRDLSINDHQDTVEAFLEACQERNDNEQFVPPSGTDSDDPLMSLLSASSFHIDVLKLRSLGRKTAFEDGVADSLDGPAQHPIRVFEFADTMATDDISVSRAARPSNVNRVHPDARLSPIDCSLVDEFVSAIPASTPPPSGGGDSCPGECGEFVNGASCQCDASCEQFGNCCEDIQEVCVAQDSCIGRCDEFVNGASCQCDSSCEQFGNCCDDFEAVCE